MSNTDLTKIYTTFGGWLKSAIYQADMTVEEVARKMRVSTNTVYSWVNGRHRPNGWGQVKELSRLVDADGEFVWEVFFVR